MKISLIAAIASSNRALGKDNQLIYKISEDLKRFKKITSGHAIIMGRKTFESIGHPLPDRINIVITRDPNYSASGCIITHSLEEALEVAQEKEKEEIFIIGGGQIFKESLNTADKLYLTLVEGMPAADTFFPDYSSFKVVWQSEVQESQGYKYIFVELEKTQD